MVLKSNWRPGEKYSADAANAVAAKVNDLDTALAGLPAGGGATKLEDLDTAVTGTQLDAMKTKVDGVEAGADVTTAARIATRIHAAAAKLAIGDTDELAVIDAAGGNALKRATFKTVTDSVMGSAGMRRQRLRDLPDRALVDTVAAKTVTAAGNQVPTYTSIASGIVACQFPNTADKVALIGCDTLVKFGAYDVWGPNWKAFNNGTSGVAPVYTSSWGVDFWCAATRYVEFSVGSLDAAFVFYKVWVDGRPITDLPQAVASAANAVLKIDLGDTNAHRVRIMITYGALGRIWVEPTGTIWPSVSKGPRLFILGDSDTQGTAANAGNELGTWLPRFAGYIGADDFWNGSISGTGPTTTTGGFPNYVTRAVNDAVPSKADLIIVGGYHNSRASTAAALETAYNTIFTALRGMDSDPDIIAFSGLDPTGVNGSPYTAQDLVVRAVCEDYGVPFISSFSGSVFDGDGNLVQDRGPWATAANLPLIANSSVGNHANDIGHKYLAACFLEAYKSLLAA